MNRNFKHDKAIFLFIFYGQPAWGLWEGWGQFSSTIKYPEKKYVGARNRVRRKQDRSEMCVVQQNGTTTMTWSRWY